MTRHMLMVSYGLSQAEQMYQSPLRAPSASTLAKLSAEAIPGNVASQGKKNSLLYAGCMQTALLPVLFLMVCFNTIPAALAAFLLAAELVATSSNFAALRKFADRQRGNHMSPVPAQKSQLDMLCVSALRRCHMFLLCKCRYA